MSKNFYILGKSRYVSILENQHIGNVAQLLIGATCVGSVHLTSKENSSVQKGEEYGYFSFGGSCVITLYSRNKVDFREDLKEQSGKGMKVISKWEKAWGNLSFEGSQIKLFA